MTDSRSFYRWFFGAASALTLLGMEALTNAPGWAADKITVKYGPFYRSVAVQDLADYSATGKPSSELASLLSLVDEKEKESLKQGLQLKFPFDVVAVDELLKSPLADGLLTQVADATILPGDTEKVALRGAMLISASSPEGLGTLSLLRSYPTPTLTVDLKKLLKLMESNKGALQGLGGMMAPGGATPGGAAPGSPAPGGG